MLDVSVRRRLDGFELDAAFQASEGTVVLFGPSGSGKSLTLQAITGIMKPDAGRIEVGGRILFDSATGVNLPPQRRRVGYVPQSYALFPHLTVAENIAYGLRGLSSADRQRRAREMIDLTGLGGLERRQPRELSGGQQQRVALARALAFGPELLLLDEPFSSIDTGLRGGLREELQDLQRRSGISTLVVTHDLEDAFLLGQRVVVFDRGRVLQQGSREEVFYRPASRRAADIVGTRNILRCLVLGRDGESLRLGWRGLTLEALPCPLAPGRTVDVCIRPTQVMIRRPDRPSHLGPPENLLRGRVVREIIRSETYLLGVRLDGIEPDPAGRECDVEIELPTYVYDRLRLDRDKEVDLSIRRSAIHVIPEDG